MVLYILDMNIIKYIKTALKHTLLSVLVISCHTSESNWSDETGEGSSGINISSETSDESVDSSEDTFRLDLPPIITTDVGTCADVEVSVEQIIPTIVILIDRSGSMNEDFGGISRWDALYDSLMSATGVINTLQSSIRFGIALYDGTPELCPEVISVMYALDNYNNIDTTYSMYVPNGDTPTGESLAQVATDLSLILSTEPKAIVLATDGEPDTCAEPDGDGRPLTIQAVQDAFTNNINTYVISVGTAIAISHLQEVANVGVGKPIDDLNPAPYYQTTDQQQLIDAFNQIIGSFVSCEYIINGEIDPNDICDGTVMIDNMIIDCGSDWDVEGNILKIFGESCDILKDGNEHQIDAKFPCDSIFIP